MQEITEKDLELVNKWIDELEKEGFTYDEMITVFRLARERFEAMKVADFEKEYNVSIVTKELRGGIKKYHVHGHLSTESDTKIGAIEKYLR